jgi:two-component system, chemotaxis family, protein-glutamate methylesterase/glutaminase
MIADDDGVLDVTDQNTGRFDVVAIAASAGGVEALTQVLGALPADFPVPILVVQHIAPQRRSMLAEILKRHTLLRVQQAEEGDRLTPGTVYVAPPDRHLTVTDDGILSLTQTPRVHWVRPSADRLFESVGASFGRRAIVVVVTGSGRDGADGVILVKRQGGTVIAQDQATSASFGMPGAAIDTGCVDLIAPLSGIAPALLALVSAEPAS